MQPKSTRPSTPAPIALQLRQEAGFGCCKCGHPIVEYHHIVPYATEPHFRPEDMMALCPNHHTQATQGAMNIIQQRELKSRPFNIVRGFAKGELALNDTSLQVNMGNTTFVGGGTLIMVDKVPLVALDLNVSGSVDLTLKLHDKHDMPLLSINKNEWLSEDPMPWDIEAGYQNLKIRNKKYGVALKLDLGKTPIIIRANLWWNGHLIKISSSTIRVDKHNLDIAFVNNVFEGCCLSLLTTPSSVLQIVSN